MSGIALVTGAQGFIGRYMVADLLCRGWDRVVGIGRSPMMPDAFTHTLSVAGQTIPAKLTESLRLAAADARYQYVQASTTELAPLRALIQQTKPDVVIHLAATRREESPAQLIDGNIQGICVLVQACRDTSVRRIVLGSSGGVYGIPAQLPLDESLHCVPIDPYAASKLGGELFARVLCLDAGISLAIGRIFNVVGPGQEERHVCGRFASQVAAMVASRMPHHLQVANLSATRDYIDVRDVAAALSHLAQTTQDGEIYNIGSGVETSVRQVVDTLLAIPGLSSQVRVEPAEANMGGVPRHVACTAKLQSQGVRSQFNFANSLTDVLTYYLGPREIWPEFPSITHSLQGGVV